jgi:hypothetical protein
LAARREKLLPWIIGGITTFFVVAIGKFILDWKAVNDPKAAPLSEEQEWAQRRAAHSEFGNS